MHFPIAVEGRGDTLKIRYRDLSFAELDRRSNQLAAGLLSYDIGKGARTLTAFAVFQGVGNTAFTSRLAYTACQQDSYQ